LTRTSEAGQIHSIEDVLKSFTNGFLLRALSGVFFVISYRSATSGLKHGLAVHLATDWPLALFTGFFFYTLYRSFFYGVFVETLFDIQKFRDWRNNGHMLIQRVTMERLLDRWCRNEPDILPNKACGHHFMTWADYTHLVYASSACIGFGAVAGAIALGLSGLEWEVRLWAPAIFLFLVAFASDWRLRAIEDYSREYIPTHFPSSSACGATTSRHP
jgi:hypothetical protein